VQLKSIVMPEMEFSHPEKGDALFAMELALSLEKVHCSIVHRQWVFALTCSALVSLF